MLIQNIQYEQTAKRSNRKDLYIMMHTKKDVTSFDAASAEELYVSTT